MDEWRPVLGFEGVYEVSRVGAVRRVAAGPMTHPGKVLRPRPSRNGYLRVALHYHGALRETGVHRLVAEAFLPQSGMEGLQVNHIDGDKANNTAENLEWCTGQQNMQHAYAAGLNRGRQGEEAGRAKLTEDQVRLIRASDEHDSILAARFGVSRSLVSTIRRGETWKCVDAVAVSSTDRRRARADGRTHCRRGHELTDDNLVINSKGVRCCRVCIRRTDAAYKARVAARRSGVSV